MIDNDASKPRRMLLLVLFNCGLSPGGGWRADVETKASYSQRTQLLSGIVKCGFQHIFVGPYMPS